MGKKIKQKILFVYDHEYPHLWKDGLYAALLLLQNDFEVEFFNMAEPSQPGDEKLFEDVDFVLGWGGFNSPVDKLIRDMPGEKGLCIGGNAYPPIHADAYDVLFYETDWYAPQIEGHKNIRKAFGVNTNIYHPTHSTKVFDVITVGAFSTWKRQHMLMKYSGNRLAIGQIQKKNLDESMPIVLKLMEDGVVISDMVEPQTLAKFYNASHLCYIPADVNGGGERAILEARACGILVDCEPDNPKLTELLTCLIPTEVDYYKSLKEGIESVL